MATCGRNGCEMIEGDDIRNAALKEGIRVRRRGTAGPSGTVMGLRHTDRGPFCEVEWDTGGRGEELAESQLERADD